jgi:hypothetical protein
LLLLIQNIQGELTFLISALLPYFLFCSYLYLLGDFGGFVCFFILAFGTFLGYVASSWGVEAYFKLPKHLRKGKT